MTGGFHEPLVTNKAKPPSERGTGLVFTAAAIVVAVLFRHNAPVWIAALAAAAVLALVSFARPALLRPLNLAWFKLSLLLNRIVNPLVMLAIFAVAFVPMGLLMRLWRDPLVRRRRPQAASYWIARDRAETGSSMRNQF
jgi:hypothetical protein